MVVVNGQSREDALFFMLEPLRPDISFRCLMVTTRRRFNLVGIAEEEEEEEK